MFLKKVCIFLVVAFLAVDVFLLSIYFHANKNLNTLSDKMLDNTAKYYESIGITIDKDIIEKRVPDNKIYTFAYSNSEVGLDAAENLASALFSAKSVVNMVETPKGMSYSINDNGKNAASLRIDTESFDFEYVHSEFSSDISGIPSEPFSNMLTDIKDSDKRAIRSFLSALYSQNKPKFAIKGSYEVGNRVTVCVEFLVDDECFVEEMFANAVIEDGMLVYAKGSIILSELNKSYSEQLYDGVNAFSKIDTATVSEFVSEKIVYSHRYAGNGVNYLIPVWKIEYIDVNGKMQTQYIDAIKG